MQGAFSEESLMTLIKTNELRPFEMNSAHKATTEHISFEKTFYEIALLVWLIEYEIFNEVNDDFNVHKHKHTYTHRRIVFSKNLCFTKIQWKYSLKSESILRF